MPITNRGTLVSTVADRLQRTDLTTQIGDCVTLTEAYFNVELPLRMAEATSTPTGTIGSRNLALPAGFAEPITLDLTTFGSFDRLRAATAETIAYSAGNGAPTAWVITGANIELDYPCDQAHTFQFRYRGTSLLALAADADTNWLLQNHPDAYLFGTLGEIYALQENAPAASLWLQRRNDIVDKIAWKESRSKSVATLQVDPALLGGRGAFNINTGR